MRSSLPRKKKPGEIDISRLVEPKLTEGQRKLFEKGVALFNERRFWEAHEAWEGVWIERPEESRIFFQGIIQAAAGYHLIVERTRISGAIKNLRKALEKLELFPATFMGLDVRSLKTSIGKALDVLSVTEKTASESFLKFATPRLERTKEGQ